ncbi:hypothetical protein AB0F68_00140 [Micromonospora sp. NPDC023966]|uniref:hypothetical protein n=1 Tax=Micromonospora sp. NPDC023966 TaxID=3154699 RepID=UPI0033FC27A0
MPVEPDGVILRAGDDDRGLRLESDAERGQFVAHLRRRSWPTPHAYYATASRCPMS